MRATISGRRWAGNVNRNKSSVLAELLFLEKYAIDPSVVIRYPQSSEIVLISLPKLIGSVQQFQQESAKRVVI